MREKLLESGLAQEEINSLQEKISSSKGFTWEELVTTLADKIDAWTSNNKKLQHFSKIGLSQEKASSLSLMSAKDIDVAEKFSLFVRRKSFDKFIKGNINILCAQS